MTTIFSILCAIGFSSMGTLDPVKNVTNQANFSKIYNAAENEIKQLHTQKIVNQIFVFLAAVMYFFIDCF